MSEEGEDRSAKTEDPSAKKLEEAHERGDVVKSQEVTTWLMLGATGIILAGLGPFTAQRLATVLTPLLANADRYRIGSGGLEAFVRSFAGGVLLVAIAPLAAFALVAIAANLIQHRPVLSVEPITPRLSKISPLAGAKRLFSRDALANFLKGLVKLGVVGAVMFFVLWPERDQLEGLVRVDPGAILPIVAALCLRLMWAVLAVLSVIAVLDYFYQRQRRWDRLKMSLEEVREEFKQMEGDPQVKGRLRQLRTQRARRRMMANVPKATVVVTNPTHYAVALAYDKSMPAPRCLAKGTDAVALRIREVAKAHDVPIVENPPLARALHAAVDIDETIPPEHFKAVAEVIGFVMRLKRRRSWLS